MSYYSTSLDTAPPLFPTSIIQVYVTGVVLVVSSAALGYVFGLRQQRGGGGATTTSPRKVDDSTADPTPSTHPSNRTASSGNHFQHRLSSPSDEHLQPLHSTPVADTFRRSSTTNRTAATASTGCSNVVQVPKSSSSPSNPLDATDPEMAFFNDSISNVDTPKNVDTLSYSDVAAGRRYSSKATPEDLALEGTQGTTFLDNVTVSDRGYRSSKESSRGGGCGDVNDTSSVTTSSSVANINRGQHLTQHQQDIFRQMEQVAPWSGALDASVNSSSHIIHQQRKSGGDAYTLIGRAGSGSRQDSLASSGLAAAGVVGVHAVPTTLPHSNSSTPSFPFSNESRSVSAFNVREHLFGGGRVGSFSERTGAGSTLEHTLSPGDMAVDSSGGAFPKSERKATALPTPLDKSKLRAGSASYYHSESGGILSDPAAMADTRRGGGPLPDFPIWRICVTGGPCSGKSTGMNVIKSELQALGFRVFIVPEVATLMINGGLEFSNMTEEKRITQQCIILRLIMELEDTFFELATSNKNPSIILCDRGTMDGSAYCSAEEFDKVLRKTGYTIAELRDARYDGIVHLVTAAIGAVDKYTTANNEARMETAEQASVMDLRTREKWTGHRMLGVFDNSTDFNGKMKKVVRFIKRIARIRTGEDDNKSTRQQCNNSSTTANNINTANTNNPQSNESSGIIRDFTFTGMGGNNGTDDIESPSAAEHASTSTTSPPLSSVGGGPHADDSYPPLSCSSPQQYQDQLTSPVSLISTLPAADLVVGGQELDAIAAQELVFNNSISDMMYVSVPVSQILRPLVQKRSKRQIIDRTCRRRRPVNNSEGGGGEAVGSGDEFVEGGVGSGVSPNSPRAQPGPERIETIDDDGDHLEDGDDDVATAQLFADATLTTSTTLSEAILAAKSNPLSIQNSDMDVLEALVACGVPTSAVVTDYLNIQLTPDPDSTVVREKISRQRTGKTYLYFHILEKNQLDATALGKTFAEKDDIVQLGQNQTTLFANAVRAADISMQRITEREFKRLRRTQTIELEERKTLICFFHKGNYFKFTSYFKPDARMVLKVPEDCAVRDLPTFFEYTQDPSEILANRQCQY